MNPSTRQALRAGARLAVQQPSLLVWYLQNRLRNGLIPLERAVGDGRAVAPRFLTLKPTLRCNLRCEFCRFVANGDVFGKRDWLELEDWKRVVDEAAESRPYICLTGGEPLMVPYLPELIAHIKRRGLICALTTNGTMLAQRADALRQAPPDLVVLSLDGPRDVHDRVRKVPGTYDRALAGARRLLRSPDATSPGGEVRPGGERLDKPETRASGQSAASPPARDQGPGTRGPAQRKPLLVVNAAITGHTWESALEMVRVAREFGAAALNFQHFWFLTRPMVDAHNARWGDCFPLDYDRVGGTATEGVDTDRLWETIRRLKAEDCGMPVLFYPELDRAAMRTYYTEPETFTHAAAPTCAWTSTDILPNGDVSPCFELVAGNVLRQPLREIWNSPAFRDHRRRLAEQGPYPVCARCCAYFRRD